MSTILVTGATGLTGECVVHELLRRGHAVRALCRSGRAPEGAELAVGDLTDPDSLTRAADGVDGIVHAACTYTTPEVDIAALDALLAGWRTGPFVFLSSLDVYGFAGPGLITEDTPVTETYNAYSRAKVICERRLAEAATAAGRDHVMLRAPYIWGPHATARRRLVGTRLVEHRSIVLPGEDPRTWSQYRDAWVDVRDLATIVAACLERPVRGPLNVLSGHFTWHDLYAELIRLLGSRSEIVHKPLDAITDDELPNKQLYAQTWQFSEERLRQRLGDIPRRPFAVTVADTALHEP